MTRSLGVRQAGTIRPRPTVHLLALTGILMARIRLSPPAGSVPNPLHPRAPLPRVSAPMHPPTGVSSLFCCSPSRRHGSGGEDLGREVGGLRAGRCRSLPRKMWYLTPGARPLGTLGKRTRLVWGLRSSMKGNFSILGDSCFYNVVLIKGTMFNLTAFFGLTGSLIFFFSITL